MQQFALFVKLNKWKEEKNPISKLEQFFFKLNKWKEEKIQLTLGLNMFVKKNVIEYNRYQNYWCYYLLSEIAIQNKIKSKNR